MHCGYVVKVENLRKHSNADRLQVATFFGNDTIVDLSVKVGDLGVYFPVDLQMSEEYCEHNNLVRKKDENGNNVGGFLDPEKRNIKAINLRGEKSDGLYMPISSFNYCYNEDATSHFNIGDQITVLNGHEICLKYIPKRQHKTANCSGNKTRKHKVNYAPLFAEHADTEQLAYNLNSFKAGDEIEVTLKMHGTSQRTGYLPILKSYKKTLWQKLFRKEGTPVYDYDYVCGTRRVVLENFNKETSFYGSDTFRKKHHDAFIGKLNKGETVYYEVVGFTDTGASIMADADNSKMGKEFIKEYGKTTVFSYGCEPTHICTCGGGCHCSSTETCSRAKPKSDFYVYRMTMTNEDGFVVEYTPDFMRYRCEQMGVKTVQLFEKFTIPSKCRKPGEYVQEKAEKYYDGPDPVGKVHVREGVVVRVINRPKFTAFKHKNWNFKVLSGIALESAPIDNISEDILTEM